MLISHDHKFIFIKPKKVAGSSIQAYLAQFCKNGINYHRDPKSHMKAADVKKMVGEEVWNSYLKVTVVRNPWDKTVSLYHWRRRKRPLYIHLRRVLRGWPWHSPAMRHDFKSYVKYLFELNDLNADKNIVRIGGELPDYFFIRFENLHDDMDELCKKLGVDYNPDDLPKKKTGHRKEPGYRQHFDEETKELVRKAHEDEIARFGYEF
ncbi:sulfotransferase family protein [Marinoscillum sp. MHG1-6]|uniref:sulfotransferase family protein n=1 Tax=Marinoscillum sp. MHG1-6 TaxID=2959627 RepID=UPI002157EA6E|nr:sulfotransferase family protein [Marinoscillum sp. MHG1-6]